MSNQATPIKVVLDGQRRSVAVRLAPIAAHATPGDRYRLQIVASTTLFYPQGSAGALTAERVDVRLPIVGTSSAGVAAEPAETAAAGRSRARPATT